MTILTFVLAGAMQNIIVALICVAAAGVVGLGAFFFLRAKNREAVDSALSVGAPASGSGLGEMRELTSRIEDIVLQQQDNGETQRQHLSRKIDSVRESVESQHHAVTGLRQEMRHEVQKRDAEMQEIRTQIEAVREGVELPPATWNALPAAELGAPEAEGPFLALSFESDDASGDDLAFTPFEDVTFGDEGDTPEAATDGLSGDSLFAASGFEEASFEDDSATPGPFLFKIDPSASDPMPSFDDPAGDGVMGEEASGFAFEELPDPLSFSAEDAPFENDASPLAFETAEESAFAPMSFSFNEDADPGSPLMPDAAGIPTLNDPDPLGFEEAAPTAFETEAMAASDAILFEESAPFAEAPEADAAPAPRQEPVFAAEPVAQMESAPAPEVVPTEAVAPEAIAPEAVAEINAEITDETIAPEAAPFISEQASIVEEPAGAFEIVSFLTPEPEEVPEAAPALGHADRGHTELGHAESRETGRAAVASGASHVPTSAPPVFEDTLTAEEPAPEPTAWISRPEREEPVQTIGGIVVDQVGDVPTATESPAQRAPEYAPEVAAKTIRVHAQDAEYAGEPASAAPETTVTEAIAPEAIAPEADMEAPAVEAAEPLTSTMRFPETDVFTPEEAAPEETASDATPGVMSEEMSFESFEEEQYEEADDAFDFPSPVVASELAEATSFDFGIDIDAEIAYAETHGQPLADEIVAPEAEAHAVEMPGMEAPAEVATPAEPFAFSTPAPGGGAVVDTDPSPEAMTMSADSFVTPPGFSAPTPAMTPAPASVPSTPPPAAPEPVAPEAVIEATPEAPSEPGSPAFEAPEGAEDLTAITSIDDEVQRALYTAGVLTLDEIARWGRSDARRISTEVGVSETTIMNQWVFEAQAALFDRFSG